MPRESVAHTLKVALLLCVVCSVVVATAAVGLRDRQQANQERQRKGNILSAADLSAEVERAGVDSVYTERIVERLVDLESGEFVTKPDATSYDQRRAARDPDESIQIPSAIDAAQLGRRERYSFVYLVKDSQGQIDQIVLPIRGYGLWSTLRGFISLDAQSLRQSPEEIAIRGLTFYEHGETPGLGGEVDNPRWLEQWREGKRVYDANWNVIMRVIKGRVDPRDSQAAYKVDGLSGATITANGVTNMIDYWFGEHGFLPFVQNINQRPERLTEGSGDG